MARAYQDAHVLDNLKDSLKSLKVEVAALSVARNKQEEKIKKLQDSNDVLVKKNTALEIRQKANEHNSAARVTNSHLAQSPDPNRALLSPLYDVGTGRKIPAFPKHERDVKVMGQNQVIQILQSLDVKTLGLGAAEKKAELRAQLGLVKEASVTSGK